MTPGENTPPHNTEAERGLLGAMLLSPEAIATAVSTLKEDEDFYRPNHQHIYRAIRTLVDKGESVDTVTVADVLGDVVGKPYLLSLVDACVTPTHASSYANAVAEDAERRRIIAAGVEIKRLAYEDDTQQMESAVAKALLDATNPGERKAVRLSALLRTHLDTLPERKPYITPSEFPSVHLAEGDLVIVGARPSVGKTMLAMQWADEWSKHIPVGVWSYEMTHDQLVARLIATHTRGAASVQRQDEGISEADVEVIREECEGLHDRDLYLSEASESVPRLVNEIRMFAARGGKVAIVDYLQLAVPHGADQRNLEVAEASRQLKRVAQSQSITVVALSQLSRYEGHASKPPTLGTLRDSGAIEQDADVVALMHEFKDKGEYKERLLRAGFEFDRDTEDVGLAQIDYAKTRQGPTQVYPLFKLGAEYRFERILKEER